MKAGRELRFAEILEPKQLSVKPCVANPRMEP